MTEQPNDKDEFIVESPIVNPTSTVQPVADDDIIEYCHWHPQTEALLHCYQCNKSICVKCAQRTPVGYICPDCKKGRKARFNQSKPRDVVIAALTALLLGLIASLVPLVSSWWFVIILSPLAGTLISEAVWRLVRHRWGPNLWWATTAGIIVGTLPVIAFGVLGVFFGRAASGSIGWWELQNIVLAIVHVALAAGSAIARLRMT